MVGSSAPATSIKSLASSSNFFALISHNGDLSIIGFNTHNVVNEPAKIDGPVKSIHSNTNAMAIRFQNNSIVVFGKPVLVAIQMMHQSLSTRLQRQPVFLSVAHVQMALPQTEKLEVLVSSVTQEVFEW